MVALVVEPHFDHGGADVVVDSWRFQTPPTKPVREKLKKELFLVTWVLVVLMTNGSSKFHPNLSERNLKNIFLVTWALVVRLTNGSSKLHPNLSERNIN